LESLKLVTVLVMTDRAYLNANERNAGPSRTDTVELQLSGLIVKAGHPDMQKI